MLLDGGATTYALGEHLDALGLNGSTIDAVILTHSHADHYQGRRELFASRRNITVRYFWENQDPSPNVTLQKLRDSIAARVRTGSLTYRDTDDPCMNGQPLCTVRLKGGARLYSMRPDPTGHGVNNRSPAIKWVGPDSAAFTMGRGGDAPAGGKRPWKLAGSVRVWPALPNRRSKRSAGADTRTALRAAAYARRFSG